jgi:sugar lactone lactonase YvrE
MSSIKGFTVDLSDLSFVGRGLARPESIIAERDGTLWISDGSQGGVTRMAPDGTQTIIGKMGGESNGLAMDREGNLYIANIHNGLFYKMYRDGSHEVLLSELDGQPLGAANYVFIDSQDRLWLSVSTRVLPWLQAASSPRPDGYIILIDEKGPRIVADGILFTNEVRMDANEAYLYAAETMASRIIRFPVREDGSLGEREVVGPDGLGHGALVDGFTFDAEGNIWLTTVIRNGLMIITPDGEAHTVFEDPNPAALDNGVAKVAAGALTPEELFACMGATLQFPASVTFAGPDLRTVYIGSLAMPHLVSFQSPVAGLPMRHW